MPNIVSFDKQKLITGLDTLFAAVASTLGPRAFAAGIDEVFRRRVVDDGVIIAKRIILEDKVENFGANLVAEAASKTADEAGDGTTATIIMAHAIIHEALKRIATGAHPMHLRQGLEEGIALLIKEIDVIKTPITGVEQATQIATISCKDPVLGALVAKTIDEMGEDGLVTTEESSASETTVDYQKGMRFESGYASAGFVTIPEKMESVYKNAKILIIDKCPSYQALTLLLTEVKKQQMPLVIIAPQIDDELKAFLLANKANPQSPFHSLCINAPYAANFQKDFMQDVALFTGANYIALTEGARIEGLTFTDLGTCEKIISTHNSTVIIGGKADEKLLKERIASIKTLIRTTPSDFASDKLKERLAKLTSGVAVIKVGGSTEVEMKERLERTVDAVAATKAALSDGIVIGGERVYFLIQHVLDRTVEAHSILLKALAEPFNQLLTNSGLSIGEYTEKLRHSSDSGVDVTTGLTVDLIAEGIIDPASVAKSVLRNAVSVAIQFLLIHVIIVPGNQGRNENYK